MHIKLDIKNVIYLGKFKYQINFFDNLHFYWLFFPKDSISFIIIFLNYLKLDKAINKTKSLKIFHFKKQGIVRLLIL